MFESGIDIDIQKDTHKGCSIININDSEDLDIWPLAKKLQSSGFVITKILQGGFVQDYDAGNFNEEDSENIETLILEYEYMNSTYVFEIDVEKIIIRPIFSAEDVLKRKLYECIADPTSVYLKTALENIESAELNLFMGGIRSASSNIYYAVHNLLKSITFSYSNPF